MRGDVDGPEISLWSIPRPKNQGSKQGREKLVSTMWTLDKLESDFRDGFDEYLARTAPASGGKVGGEVSTGAGPTQPNNGGRAGTELSQPVPDGIGQKAN